MPKFTVEVMIFTHKFFDSIPANSPAAAAEGAKVILGSLCKFSAEKITKTELSAISTGLSTGWGYPAIALWSGVMPVEVEAHDIQWAGKKADLEMLNWCHKRFGGDVVFQHKVISISEKKDSARRR